jgi:hypothetical protein
MNSASDNPTIQDLNNFYWFRCSNIHFINWWLIYCGYNYTENGVTYGASVDGTTACESSEKNISGYEVEFTNGYQKDSLPNSDGINDRFVIPDIATNYPNYTDL